MNWQDNLQSYQFNSNCQSVIDRYQFYYSSVARWHSWVKIHSQSYWTVATNADINTNYFQDNVSNEGSYDVSLNEETELFLNSGAMEALSLFRNQSRHHDNAAKNNESEITLVDVR